MNIICDLDGTIALDHKRNHYLHPVETRDWDSYFAACDTDDPCHAVIDLLQTYYLDSKYKIWILSGRSMSASGKTLKWLVDNHVPYHGLQMRSQSDRTQDDILKLKWAESMGFTPKNTLFVLEDRQRVVDAWRKAGFTCFQVAEGKF